MKELELMYPQFQLSQVEASLLDLLPKHKLDIDVAQLVVDTDYREIEYILPHLLTWLQDMNWPVAQVLAPMFADIGPPLSKHVAHILKSKDEIWKYWVLLEVVDVDNLELATSLRSELLALLQGDDSEGVPDIAQRILKRLNPEL